MDPEAQQKIVTVLSQPVAVLVAFAWVLGIVIWLTWWVTRRVSRFATWEGVARMIATSESSQDKALREHKQEDLRLFTDLADRYQRGMEMASEKFTAGMDKASEKFTEGMSTGAGYLRDVTRELKSVNDKADKNAVHLGEVRGALKVMLPEDKANEIFKEAS